MNLLCISDETTNKSEPNTDFQIVLNGLCTINLLHRKFESSFVRNSISLHYFADCLFMYIFMGY